MKGEYQEDKTHPPSCTTTMLSKFHHHHHQQQTPPPPPPPQHFGITTTHQFQLSNTSEEADSRKKDHVNDGASIEVARRPRGRPPGSKNKPKPPIIITREPDQPSMSPYVLELTGGIDIVDAVSRYCRKRNMGLTVLTGSGIVANVSLRQPSTTVTFHGRFDILSISATVVPPSSSAAVAPFANAFTISLAGPQGQIVGGAVAGPLMSAGTVYIIAASFNNPLYHRLPSEEEDDNLRNSGGGGSEQSPPPAAGGGSGGGDSYAPPSTAADMYNHQPSDVIWAPTARQHPPPY